MNVQEIIQVTAQHKVAPLIDLGSLTIVGVTLMDIISPMAAFASLIWVGMRIYISYIEIKAMRAKKK